MVQITYGLVGICLILMLFSFITDSMSKKRKMLLFFMASATMVLTASDCLAHAVNGMPGTIPGIVVRGSKLLAYTANLCIVYIFAEYLKDLLKKEGNTKNLPITITIVKYVLAVGSAVLLLSQFIGLYYTYDENNLYHRGSGYFISYLFPFAAIFLLISIIVENRKNLSKRMFIPLLLFTIMPVGSSALHLLGASYTLTAASVVAMTVLLYCFSILDANEIMRSTHDREVKNQKLMLSQTAEALAEAIDAKDSYTKGHSSRVAKYSAMIAEAAGKTKDECDEIYLIALLHDVGKIAVPGSIINKPGRLTDEEYEIIKTHPTRGKEILEKISISPNLAIGAHYHHERYDGKGYPEGLKGEEIPEIARIIAVADTYDAMTSKRSYRDGLPIEKVIAELKNGMGSQFDTRFAGIMVDLINDQKV